MMKTKSFLFSGKNISYHLYGEGRPVMMIHGFGEDSRIWKRQVDFLQQHFRLIVPDLPGSAESDFVPLADIDVYADIIQQLCEAEKVKPGNNLTLIGHSMGGYITLAFAEKFPSYLQQFGLFHSTAFADSEEKKEMRRKAIEFIRNNGAAAFLKASIPGLFSEEFKKAHSEKIESLVNDGHRFSNEAVIQYYEAMIARPDRTHILKETDKPVLFILGVHDMAVPFQSGLQQCHFPDQSHLHILRHSAHMGMWEEADRSNKALLNFLLKN